MRYFTVSEAADTLQLSVPTVKRYIYEGKLKSTKLPGGQHRIAASEVERLLGAAAPSAELGTETEARLAVLERWVTEQEAEIERLNAALTVLSNFCSYQGEALPAAPTTADAQTVLVLGPGCQKCRALHELTERVLQVMGRGDVAVEAVKDLDAIAAFGPVLTPALVVGNEIVLSGRVPSPAALRELLERLLDQRQAP